MNWDLDKTAVLNEVKSKFPNHILVAVFGGSNAFSILVKDEDTFTQKLEKKLNNDEV